MCPSTTAATSSWPPTCTKTRSNSREGEPTMNSTSGAYDHFRRWATKLLAHQRVAAADDAEVYQFSTISALLEGVYDGDVTIADILRHGDFSLGTFNHLDGEMVVL